MHKRIQQLDTRSIWPMALLLLLLGGSACNASRDIDIGDDADGGTSGTDSGSNPRRDMRRNRDAACASATAQASLTKKPVDIIFVIDNSGSMSEEIQGVQDNINTNFADIIQKSGLDYRVIMLTSHGDVTFQQVCIKSPLSKTTCNPIPNQPGNNPPKFYHYSTAVDSTNSLDVLLDSYNGLRRDDFQLFKTGWSSLLRPEAFKIFVEITDDNQTGMTYQEFDQALLGLTPKHFGTATSRNYVWHSIVGVPKNATNPANPWLPKDPILTSSCPSAVNSGQVYQRLSMLTGGLRFPICELASFDSIFNNIAQGVITGSKVACDFPLPAPPAGEVINLNSVLVTYTPMGTGTPETFRQVPNVNQCAAGAFYLQNSRIYLCPDACQEVQQDNKASVNIIYDCVDIVG